MLKWALILLTVFASSSGDILCATALEKYLVLAEGARFTTV